MESHGHPYSIDFVVIIGIRVIKTLGELTSVIKLCDVSIMKPFYKPIYGFLLTMLNR